MGSVWANKHQLQGKTNKQKGIPHIALIDPIHGQGHGTLLVPAPEQLGTVSSDFGSFSAPFEPGPVRAKFSGFGPMEAERWWKTRDPV